MPFPDNRYSAGKITPPFSQNFKIFRLAQQVEQIVHDFILNHVPPLPLAEGFFVDSCFAGKFFLRHVRALSNTGYLFGRQHPKVIAYGFMHQGIRPAVCILKGALIAAVDIHNCAQKNAWLKISVLKSVLFFSYVHIRGSTHVAGDALFIHFFGSFLIAIALSAAQ